MAARYHATQQLTRTISCTSELERLWKLDSLTYGSCSIPFQQLLEWWQAYPNGIIALFHQTVIQGAIEIWPLSSSVAQQFSAGKLRERDIPADQMCPFVTSPCANWYLSGMMLRTMQRRTTAIKAILAATCSIFVANVTFSVSNDHFGARLFQRRVFDFLRRFGFHKMHSGKTMPDGCPLYALQVNTWLEGVQLMRSRCLLGRFTKKRQPAVALSAC